MLFFTEDISRYNCLDKVIGYMARAGKIQYLFRQRAGKINGSFRDNTVRGSKQEVWTQ
ncbi:MAG: formate dehydrogenase accessory sulfurtransferase FdhD [Actinomycetia bacterium]|nr:formate dehydrogenase accessory sulfurtransferase FdhD [Actinomycetes bacterium]